jgi:serine/threonine protein kinase
MSSSSRAEGAPEAFPATLRNGRYRVRGLLGTGSQAQTLEAEDTETGATVAIKRFQIRGAKSWKDVELAEREARVLAELQHPSLPRYIDYFEEDGGLCLVMEKVEGATLADPRGALSHATVLRFLSEAAETLAYLHGLAPPVIHRDIKPRNVIQRPDGSFALVDFGSVGDRLRPEGGSTIVGTFGYMAPEQFQGRALPATDVYGVAATSVACLSGQEPENLPHRGLAIDVPAALAGRADPLLIELLSRLLEPDPDRRPAELRGPVRNLLEKKAARERTQGRARDPEPTREPRQRAGTNSRERRDAGAPWDAPDFFQDLEELRNLSARMKDARRQRRRDFRDTFREEKRRRRYERRFRREHSGRLPPLVLFVVLLGLLVARVATFALFRVFLPTLLTVLAVFFGPGLRRAAERCHEIADAGAEGLRRASRHVRGLSSSLPPPEGFPAESTAEPDRRQRRVRIDDSRLPPDGDSTIDAHGEEAWDDEADESHGGRRSRV